MGKEEANIIRITVKMDKKGDMHSEAEINKFCLEKIFDEKKIEDFIDNFVDELFLKCRKENKE